MFLSKLMLLIINNLGMKSRKNSGLKKVKFSQ